MKFVWLLMPLTRGAKNDNSFAKHVGGLIDANRKAEIESYTPLGAHGLLDRKDAVSRALMPLVVERFAQWTMTLNGAGLGRDDEIDDTPHEWNDAYFRVAAHALPELGVARIGQLIVAPLCGLPDEPR